MPAEIYEIVALAARFWFLFLMALIVWRSYRWYARERRQRKKRLRLLPDAGYIGEFVVMQSAGDLSEGDVLSVPFEGTLGFVRSNDLCVPVPGVAARHLWFSYDELRGLKLTALGGSDFAVDEVTIGEQPDGLYVVHGSRLYVGDCELRLRMFAGYEVCMAQTAAAAPMAAPYQQPEPGRNGPPQGQPVYGGYSQPVPGQPYGDFTPPGNGYGDPRAMGGYAPYGSPPMQPGTSYGAPVQNGGFVPWENGRPHAAEAYAQGTYARPAAQAASRQAAAAEPPMSAFSEQNAPRNAQEPPQPHSEPETFHPLLDEEDWEEYTDDEYAGYGNEEAIPGPERSAEENLGPTADPFAPAGGGQPEGFYPLEVGEEEWPTLPRADEWRTEGLFDDLLDEDGTDASAPPKSAYVGRDEAAWAKRRIWDKYFGGGDAP